MVKVLEFQLQHQPFQYLYCLDAQIGRTKQGVLRQTEPHLISANYSGPQPFWHQGPVSRRQFFHGLGWRGCFQNDSSTLHLLCTLHLLLLHQFHFRSPDIRSQCLVCVCVCVCVCACVRAYSLSCVQLLVTPWTLANQASLSIGILEARIHALLQGIFPS